MNITKIREIIRERIRLSIETQDEWEYGLNKCRQSGIAMLSEDLAESSYFLENDCTDEELYWLSEILEDIVLQTRSRLLIESFKRRLAKVARTDYIQSIQREINYAERLAVLE